MGQWSETLSELKPFIQKAWENSGFKEPSPVQQSAVPLILQGRDLIAESPTGSGKTLAYLLPLLDKVKPEVRDPQAVILAPTRELVMQIHQEMQKFSLGSEITVASFIGGADIKRQVEKLKKHPQAIVGTPGRIQELIKLKKLKMHEVKTIVVDEADQMTDMGFMTTIQEIVGSTMKDRQLLFFSATIPQKVEDTGNKIMQNPEVIRITREEMPASRTEHLYLLCERRDKMDLLRRIAKMEPPVKALVFMNDNSGFLEAAAKLQYKGIPLGVLHGESKKTERETVLKNFRSGKFPLLLATDLAARGLDIEGLTHVIHFDLPQELEQYVHRSGRTGRMGKEGTVISLVTPAEESTVQRFSRQLGVPIARKSLYSGKIVDSKVDSKVTVKPEVRAKRSATASTSASASKRQGFPPGRKKQRKP